MDEQSKILSESSGRRSCSALLISDFANTKIYMLAGE